jgi:hypothetical protein
VLRADAVPGFRNFLRASRRSVRRRRPAPAPASATGRAAGSRVPHRGDRRRTRRAGSPPTRSPESPPGAAGAKQTPGATHHRRHQPCPPASAAPRG